MSAHHEQTIDIRELPTKKVTFYPNKAEILREIADVKLKPGLNEINIIGVTPIADDNSIKVEAHGSTTVTDMLVECIDNPESFEDVYPVDEDDSASDSSESDSDTPSEVKDLDKAIERLQIKHDAKVETISNNTQSLQILENLINKFEFKSPEEMTSAMQIYQERRTTYYDALSDAKESRESLSMKLMELKSQKQKLKGKHEKQRLRAKLREEKANKAASRAEFKAKESKMKEILEKATFWPKKVYRVKVTIELNIMTPGTSRRGSFESLDTANTILADDARSEPTMTSLLLSYVVDGASWVPKYDLNISTITETGTLQYRAEIRNETSETWREAKIVLSTSRTASTKVSEPIPVIKPWLLRLIKAGQFGATDSASTLSHQERNQIGSSRPQISTNPHTNGNLFGVPADVLQRYRPLMKSNAGPDYQNQLMLLEQQNRKRLLFARQEQSLGSQVLQQQQQAQQSMPQTMPQMMPQQPMVLARASAPPPPPAPPGGSLFGSSRAGALFGSTSTAPAPAGQAPAFGKLSPSNALESFDFDAFLDAGDPSVPAPEADWEESGLTTTLELRGSRTVAPSASARRFKIATVRLNQLSLNHIVVPKLRAEAFLRARIINTSPSALLKGSAGLTLDGTFLGHTSIPRCSAGENFPLPLGVDPAITVSYPTPVFRKNLNTGMFTKELSSNYARAVILTNTRSGGAAINLTVRDQIPVSEDERLKIDILVPKGLQEEGDKAKAGVEFLSAQTAKIESKSGSISAGGNSAGTHERTTSSTKSSAWGSAIAKLNKFGAIEWTVSLNPGKSVRLNLEYTIRYPGTEAPTEIFKDGASPFSA